MSSRFIARSVRRSGLSSSRRVFPAISTRLAHTRPAQGREQYSEDPGVVAGRGNKDQLKSDTTSDVENPHQDVGQQQAEAQRTGSSTKLDSDSGGIAKGDELKRPEGTQQGQEKKGPHLPI
ncbi:hypothetical protein CKM354_001081900 [Cercospora kikuchii]|uniref:Uncharacterized protein n=1 Tax=Cercospora kikuchii TaxID=84275 RepID=A0A9P3CRR5_9PEZI|nr:uncharacterized protein CKM354_001081900 [Cercospora kikuchii]GIZ47734.1 hypothetical protein CKM354_001081900 [Cercospora kikuchii]